MGRISEKNILRCDEKLDAPSKPHQDMDEPDPSRRYKMTHADVIGGRTAITKGYSRDGSLAAKWRWRALRFFTKKAKRYRAIQHEPPFDWLATQFLKVSSSLPTGRVMQSIGANGHTLRLVMEAFMLSRSVNSKW